MEYVDDLVVNPKEAPEAVKRTEFSLSQLGLGVMEADFGDSTIEGTPYRTEQGIALADRRPKERVISLTLMVREEGEVTLPQAAQSFQTVVGELQQRSTWIRRDHNVGGKFGSTLFRVTGEVTVSNFAGWSKGQRPDVTLTLVAQAVGYSTVEDEHGPFESGSKRHCEYSLPASKGTAQGLKRIRIKNEGEEDWRGLIWAEECVDAPASLEDPTAQLAYEAVDLTPLGGAAIGGPAPEVRAVGVATGGEAAVSPGLPAGTQPGDLLIMVAESGGPTTGTEATTALTAAGWSSPPSPYAAQVKGNTRLTILYRIATGTDPTTTNDTGDHQVAQIIGIKAGTFDPAEPFNTAGVGTQFLTKSVSIPGATTTRDNCLVVACASGHLPDAGTSAEFGAATNASLTGLTERIDVSIANGDGGAIYAATGVKATHGTYSATTLTAVTEAERGVISLAVNPLPTYVKHSELTSGWLTILGSEIAGVGHMTHVGPRRMWMRVQQLGGEAGDVQLRLLYRSLGASRWVEDNAVISTYAVGDYILVDLESCRPERAVTGEQRWEWRLMARAFAPQVAVQVRDVYPLPTEQYAVLREPYNPPVADQYSTKSAGKGQSLPGLGGGAWSNPENVKASDNSHATATTSMEEVLSGSPRTQPLRVTQFGHVINESAVITGIVVEVERSCESGAYDVHDNEVRLLKALTPVGKEHRDPIPWPTTDAVQTYGGSEDLWGTNLTAADVMNSGFGVQIRARSDGSGMVARIDHVLITVYYTELSGEDRVCFATRSVELRSDLMQRQAREEDVWGRLVEDGFKPHTTPGGIENRPSRGIIIASQGDLEELPDTGTNPLSATVHTRDGLHYSREG